MTQTPTGSGPPITYIDLTDATDEAIGMTGRFLRGRPEDIVALTLIVFSCFSVALFAFSRPARDQIDEELIQLSDHFSLLSLTGFILRVLAAILSFGWFSYMWLWVARATFAKDNLYWERRGRTPRVIEGRGVSLRELWRDLHRFRDTLERQAGRTPTRLRWLSRIFQFLAGLIALSPIILTPFKDLENSAGTDSFLFRAAAIAFVLYLISLRLRVPPVGDWSYRTRAWLTLLTGLGIVAVFFGVTVVGARLLGALIDSGAFPSSQSSKLLAGIYLLLAAALAYGWVFALLRVISLAGGYVLRARRIGLAQARDRERRDPRAPIYSPTVLRR